MGPRIVVFTPIYNELDSFPIIRRNIRKFRKVIPDIEFLFSDNCSTDGTWEQLLKIKSELGKCVTVLRNEKNVGFSRNLLAPTGLSDETLVILFSANDEVFTAGLRKLYSKIVSDDADFYLTNWAYTSLNSNGRPSILARGDVYRSFSATSLNEVFAGQPYVPIGISQYALRARYFKALNNYVEWSNPQIGLFFDALPCRFVAIGDIPLAIVSSIEKSGWRSSAERIVETHLNIVREVLTLLKDSSDRGNIDRRTYRRIRNLYLQIPTVHLLNHYLFHSWGQRTLPLSRRISFVRSCFSKTMGLLDVVGNTRFNQILLIRIMLWKIFVKTLDLVLPRCIYNAIQFIYSWTIKKPWMILALNLAPENAGSESNGPRSR